MSHLRRAITSDDIDPEALSTAEKLQWTGWQRRDEVNGTVRTLHGQGRSIKGIVRTTGVSRQTVRRILAGTQDDVFRSRETTLDRWAERLNADRNGGCRNGAELWRRLRDAGYGGSQPASRGPFPKGSASTVYAEAAISARPRRIFSNSWPPPPSISAASRNGSPKSRSRPPASPLSSAS